MIPNKYLPKHSLGVAFLIHLFDFANYDYEGAPPSLHPSLAWVILQWRCKNTMSSIGFFLLLFVKIGYFQYCISIP